MKKLLFFLSVLIFCSILYIVFFAKSFLSFKNQIDSNNIIIESWISAYEIEKAAELYIADSSKQYIVIGQYFDNKRNSEMTYNNKKKSLLQDVDQNNEIQLLKTSSLIFNLQTFPDSVFNDTTSITINIKGTLAEKFYAHFNVVVNENLLGSSFSSEEFQEYEYIYFTDSDRINSLSVFFDNDLCTESADRNLIVKSITINGFETNVNKANASITREQNKLTTGFISHAEVVANYFNDIGIKETRIHTLGFKAYRRNNTFSAAKAIKQWNSESLQKTVNVISSGIHSRRTWITYKRLLEPDTKVGIINFQTKDCLNKKKLSRVENYINISEESFSYLVNWIEMTF